MATKQIQIKKSGKPKPTETPDPPTTNKALAKKWGLG